MFPRIENITDIEHAFDPEYFARLNKNGYTVFDYRFITGDTFDHPDPVINAIRKEFRGLTFCAETGKILRRPYHKFFNVNEKPETRLENLNLSDDHHVLDKLDGSMIAPFSVGGEIIWGTRAGKTSVGDQAEEYVKTHPEYKKFVEDMIGVDVTPIFEWCSNKQRIVLDYPEDRLILTAIRINNTGNYYSYDRLDEIAWEYNIPVVKTKSLKSLNQELLDEVKDSEEEMEGYVVRFATGQMVKLKTSLYCQLHRTKSYITRERYVTELIVDGKSDDLKPMLTPPDALEFEGFETALKANIIKEGLRIYKILMDVRMDKMTRKDFAINIATKTDHYVGAIIFPIFDDQLVNIDFKQLLLTYIKNQCINTKRYENIRKTSLFNGVPVWKERFLE